MKREFTYPSHDGKTQIHAFEWLPEGEPRAVLQLCHGMCEFIGRYEAFAHYMAQQGFCVVGNDHLGHGASVTDRSLWGFFDERDGNGVLLADLHTLREATQGAHPGLPYFLLGHSMGSFLTRQYIARHGAGLAGAVIMGTGSQPPAALSAGIALCRMTAAARGWPYRSSLINNIAFGSYNKRFEPARTKTDWLTKDAAVVDAYNADPRCTFMFTVNGYYSMFLSIRDAQDPKTAAAIPKELPLLLVSGAEDPVGDFGKGVEQAYRLYRDACLRDVTCKLWPGDRHEVLNETDRAEVYEDLLAWMTARMAGG